MKLNEEVNSQNEKSSSLFTNPWWDAGAPCWVNIGPGNGEMCPACKTFRHNPIILTSPGQWPCLQEMK